MMKIISKILLMVAIFVGLLLGSDICPALASDQEVSLLPGSSNNPVGSSFTLTVQYDVSDSDNTLTSLGVRVHFDSTKLDFTGFENLFETGKLADPQLQDDVANNDNDDNTDKLVLLSYSDPFGGTWPKQNLPLTLVTFNFSIKKNIQANATKVNISRVTGHVGYGFVGKGAVVNLSNK